MNQRIALLSAYSRHNTGDWLLIKHALDLIETQHPGVPVDVVAADNESLSGLGAQVSAVPSPVRIASARNDIPRYALEFTSGGKLGGSLGTSSIRNASAAYTIGGGYLQFRSAREIASVSLVHAAQAYEAHHAGVPLTMLPQSVGPFAGRFGRAIARQILSWFPVVNVRERISFEYVHTLNPAIAVQQLPDLVFWDDAKVRDSSTGAIQGAKVGLVVRNWWFPAASDPAAAEKKYLTAFAELADSLSAAGHTPVLMVHADGPTDRGDDRIACQKVQGIASTAIPVEEVVTTDDLDVVRAAYATFDLVVSTRMHAALISIAEGVPTVCVGYEWKARGIFEDLGIGEYVTPIESLDLSQVQELLRDPCTWPADSVADAWRSEHLRLRAAYPRIVPSR